MSGNVTTPKFKIKNQKLLIKNDVMERGESDRGTFFLIYFLRQIYVSIYIHLKK